MGRRFGDDGVTNKKKGERRRAAVVVLGDIGRCPRMQYHALSLSKQGGLDVDIVAFSGTDPHAALLEDPKIHLHLMVMSQDGEDQESGKTDGTSRPEECSLGLKSHSEIKKSHFPVGLPRALYLLLLPFKVLLQVVTLLWVLCFEIPAPDLFLVQNPPSIPTLTVVRFACWFRTASFVIDWHNFGYTLLGLNLGPNHPLVKIHFWYERRYGKMADGYLCVTKAMQHELAQNWGINATVVYDRSPEFFRPISVQEKHELMSRLHKAMVTPLGNQDCCSEYVEDTENGEDLYESTLTRTTESTEDAGPSTRVGYDGRGLSSLLGDNAVETRGLLQGDYIVPNVHHSVFTSHTMVEDLDGDTAEILEGDLYSNREGRPALIISSTSWTADEDFNILLEAALMYDRRVAALLGENDSVLALTDTALVGHRKSSPFPRLLIVVTGKGPMRAVYEEQIRKLRLRRVAFRTMWVSAEDYPLLLGSADLGVCLHTSSSGLDLPMKVVDMFGCGLPVCAASYSCIGELVKDRQNGLLFSSSSELADQLLDLFKGFPNACDSLSVLGEGAKASGSGARWDDEWSEHVLPLIKKVGSI